MFAFAAPRTRRRPSLTPMIDVVFLLLVFFVLASRFGQDTAVPVTLGRGGAEWSGPPRLVEVRPEGLSVNGIPRSPEDAVAELARLVATSDDPVVILPRGDTTLQRLLDVMETLSDAGFASLVLAEDR